MTKIKTVKKAVVEKAPTMISTRSLDLTDQSFVFTYKELERTDRLEFNTKHTVLDAILKTYGSANGAYTAVLSLGDMVLLTRHGQRMWYHEVIGMCVMPPNIKPRLLGVLVKAIKRLPNIKGRKCAVKAIALVDQYVRGEDIKIDDVVAVRAAIVREEKSACLTESHRYILQALKSLMVALLTTWPIERVTEGLLCVSALCYVVHRFYGTEEAEYETHVKDMCEAFPPIQLRH